MTDPIPMRLTCEGCGKLHIDEGEFATKPHHTHSCQFCGLTWRPAVVHTVGVQFLPGFKNDPPPERVGIPIVLGERWEHLGYRGPIEPGIWEMSDNLGGWCEVIEHSGDAVLIVGGGRYAEREFRSLFRPQASMIQGLRGNDKPIEVGHAWKSIGDASIATVRELGSYITGERKITLSTGQSHNELYLRKNYARWPDADQKPSPFKLHDYVRCKADGRIGYVRAVNSTGDTECPGGNRIYVHAIEKPSSGSGWISDWFELEQLERWVPRSYAETTERVEIRDGEHAGLVAVPMGVRNGLFMLYRSGSWLGDFSHDQLKPAPPPLSLCCILGGEEVFVNVDAHDTLEWVRSQALAKRKNHHRATVLHDWEIRDVSGVWLDPILKVKQLASLQGTERPALYINPPIGSGG